MADEQLWVSALVAPDVLNPLKQTNRGRLSDVMVALDVQTLDGASDFWKLLSAALLLELQQVTREVSERDIQQVLVVRRRAIRWTRLHEQRHDLVFGNHGAFADI